MDLIIFCSLIMRQDSGRRIWDLPTAKVVLGADYGSWICLSLVFLHGRPCTWILECGFVPPCMRVKRHSEGLDEGLWTPRFLLLASGDVRDFRRWILAFFTSDMTSHEVRSQSIFLDVRLSHTHFSREWTSGFWTPMDLVKFDRRDRPCPAEWTVDFGPRRRKNCR